MSADLMFLTVPDDVLGIANTSRALFDATQTMECDSVDVEERSGWSEWADDMTMQCFPGPIEEPVALVDDQFIKCVRSFEPEISKGVIAFLDRNRHKWIWYCWL